MARDQNGNPLRRDVRMVRSPDGRVGYAATCWFGSSPATDIRRHVYATRADALDADVSDDYSNSSMIAFNVRSDIWQPVK